MSKPLPPLLNEILTIQSDEAMTPMLKIKRLSALFFQNRFDAMADASRLFDVKDTARIMMAIESIATAELTK